MGGGRAARGAAVTCVRDPPGDRRPEITKHAAEPQKEEP